MQQHPATVPFGPRGMSLGGPVLTPEQSLQWVQEIVAAYDLNERVPEEVLGYYDVSRRLHVYGYFDYRFFTIAHERATFAAEFAVRRRFLDWHDGRVPVERGEGGEIESGIIQATDTWKFDAQFRRKRRRRLAAQWRLQGHPAFDGSFGAHLEWARTTIDLGRYFAKAANAQTGDERPGRLDALRDLRNMAAHPSVDMRVMPVDSARSIEFSWRFINALWGVPARESFY